MHPSACSLHTILIRRGSLNSASTQSHFSQECVLKAKEQWLTCRTPCWERWLGVAAEFSEQAAGVRWHADYWDAMQIKVHYLSIYLDKKTCIAPPKMHLAPSLFELPHPRLPEHTCSSVQGVPSHGHTLRTAGSRL